VLKAAAVCTKIKGKAYPNTKSLAEQLETCRKTVQHDSNFMRGWLGVPLRSLKEYIGKNFEIMSSRDTWTRPFA
jgi:hypothetical protein